MERFFQLSSDLLCIADISGRFVRVSDSWHSMLGWRVDELISLPFLGFVHPDDHAATGRIMADMADGKAVGEFTNRYRSKNGEYRHLSWRSTPTEDCGLIYAVARDVTEQIRRRRADEKRERQLAEALRLGRLGFWELDATTGDLYWSPEIYPIYGLEAGATEPSYQTLLGLVHPDDRDAVVCAYKHSVQARTPYRIDHRLLLKDGSIRWLRTRGETGYAADGTPLRSAGTVQDVTEEKNAAYRLASERSRLRAVMDTIPDLVFIKGTDFRYIGWNKPFLDFCGLTERHLAGRNDFEVFPDKTAQFFREQDLAMLADGSERRNEEWVEYPDGRRVLLETVKVPFLDIEGRPAGLVGVSRDITRRYQADQQALEREALYRGAVEAADDGFWQADANGRILDANSAYARMSGYSIEELKAFHISDLDVDEGCTDTARRIGKIIENGAAAFEVRHRRKDGSIWDVEASTIYSDISGGRFFVFLRDMAARRQADITQAANSNPAS